jgi:hypothetical protein
MPEGTQGIVYEAIERCLVDASEGKEAYHKGGLAELEPIM